MPGSSLKTPPSLVHKSATLQEKAGELGSRCQAEISEQGLEHIGISFTLPYPPIPGLSLPATKHLAGTAHCRQMMTTTQDTWGQVPSSSDIDIQLPAEHPTSTSESCKGGFIVFSTRHAPPVTLSSSNDGISTYTISNHIIPVLFLPQTGRRENCQVLLMLLPI